MTDGGVEPFPRVTCHPGRFVRWTLEHVGMSQVEFARLAGYSQKQINVVVNGHEDISARMATQLAEILGVPYAVWMQLQHQHHRNLENGAVTFGELLERHTTPRPKRRARRMETPSEAAPSMT